MTTTPINLTQLRERWKSYRHIGYIHTQTCDEVLALIDTAEAAIEAEAMAGKCPECQTTYDGKLPHTHRLRETLNHYTTTP
jgi:hypothetical protein